jgi:aspartate aminotransferase
VVNFAGGEPDFDTPEYIKKAAIKAIEEGYTKYTPSEGASFLKEAIINKFKKDNDLNYSSDQIVVSCGAKYSLFCAIQVLCQEQDEVIISSPYWVSYPEMVRFSGASYVVIKTLEKNDFKVKAETLEKYITDNTKLFILNSPSNPAGTIYSRQELEDIASVLIKNRIYCLSDEIYEKIIYGNKKHVSIASLSNDMYKLTITVNGVSKAYSMTGWRIGYLGATEDIATKIKNLQSHSTSNPSSISQKAAAAALRDSEDTIKEMVKKFKERRDKIVDGLNKIKGFSCRKPEGSFYCFCNIKDTGLDSMKLANKLLDEIKVVVIPGVVFGDDDYIRISYACNMEEIEEGLNRLKKLFG